jgi:hypothetical protein
MLSWHPIRNELDDRLRNTQNGAALGLRSVGGQCLLVLPSIVIEAWDLSRASRDRNGSSASRMRPLQIHPGRSTASSKGSFRSVSGNG